jgi:hypothetical protein
VAADRDWFAWSGWAATIFGTALSIGQLLYAVLRIQTVKLKDQQQALPTEPVQVRSSGRGGRFAFPGVAVRRAAIRTLFLIAIFQPLVGVLATVIVLGDAPRSGPYIAPVLTQDERVLVNAAGLVLMLLIGCFWASGAWRLYKRLRDSGGRWLFLPIAGALATSGFTVIVGMYSRLGLDWISMLYTYREVNYTEILQQSHSRLQAIAVLIFTWNALSLSVSVYRHVDGGCCSNVMQS